MCGRTCDSITTIARRGPGSPLEEASPTDPGRFAGCSVDSSSFAWPLHRQACDGALGQMSPAARDPRRTDLPAIPFKQHVH